MLGFALSMDAISARGELAPAPQPSVPAANDPSTNQLVSCDDLARMAAQPSDAKTTPVPCDRVIAARVGDCAYEAAQRAGTHRASLSYILAIYKQNKCQFLVCNISAFLYLRKREQDVVTSPALYLRTEDQQARFAEQCLAHPENALDPKTPEYIETNLPGQRRDFRHKWKNLRIAGAATAGLSIASLVIGITGEALDGKPSASMFSCSYGGILATQCINNGIVPISIGFILTGASTLTSAVLFGFSYHYKKKFLGDTTDGDK